MQNTVNIQRIVMDVDSCLWRDAKIQAVKEGIDLRDFVMRSIKNELAKIESQR